MRPTFSIIFFTTASGAGYGLLFLLGTLNLLGVLPYNPLLTITSFAVALGLVTAGLLSSTLHLGNPQRAWRALSQWRSSWLSREGVMAIITYLPALCFAGLWWLGHHQEPLGTLVGLSLSLCAAITIYTTAMIYASLRTIPHWYHLLVAPNYLILGLTSGSAVLYALLTFFEGINTMLLMLTTVLMVIGLSLKRVYWRDIDQRDKAGYADASPKTATGLGHLGKVRSLEHPHSQANWVMREMGFVIARDHSRSLRMLCQTFLSAALACIILGGLIEPSAFNLLLSLAAVILLGVAVVLERWLLFAEAKHVVRHFYSS
jgi:DMSO reductase anchor subunit